jgi:hypothetical protein
MFEYPHVGSCDAGLFNFKKFSLNFLRRNFEVLSLSPFPIVLDILQLTLAALQLQQELALDGTGYNIILTSEDFFIYHWKMENATLAAI